MKKSDLKTGMRVELRDGYIYIVLKDCETRVYGLYGHQDIMFIGLTGFMTGSDYDEDLRNSDDSDYDIIKVYQSNPDAHDCDRDTLNFDRPYHCIWTRDSEEENLSKKLDKLESVVEQVTNDIEKMRKQICKKH